MSEALDAARAALRDETAWLVGGAVRDRLLGRDDRRHRPRRRRGREGGGAPPRARGRRAGVRALARRSAPGGSSGPGASWQIDLSPMRGSTIEADLALRDFTVNAIAEPLQGGRADRPARRRRGHRGVAACGW